MKYIYDIVVNFNEKYYDFFEWNEKDNIEYIKKIPIIKVSNSVIRDLKVNKIVLREDFIKNIYNKTEVYMDFGIGTIEYACLFSSNDSCIVVEFNHKGISIYKSDLLIDEAIDIINYCKKMKEHSFEYKIIDCIKVDFITRDEIYMMNFIKRELKECSLDKLKYLYYECFNNKCDSDSKIIVDLEKYMNIYPSKLFNLLMLSYIKK